MRSKWMPIETAPKDHRSVIVAALYPGRWVVGEAHYVIGADDVDGWWWAGETPGDYHAERISPQPTVWMPLPEPPND